MYLLGLFLLPNSCRLENSIAVSLEPEMEGICALAETTSQPVTQNDLVKLRNCPGPLSHL